MAQWTDIARFIGPTPNRNEGQMGAVFGVCMHVDEGNEAGSESWELNPNAHVSSHFMQPKDTTLRQMVDTADLAWAQAAGNPNYLSVECEGYSGQPLTDVQIEGLAQLLAKAHMVHGVPIVLADTPGQKGLIYHAAGGDAWGGHPDCPGAPIIAQRPAILARAAELVDGHVISHPYPGFNLVRGMSNRFVMWMQEALNRDGYSCGPAGNDGKFGPDTAAALGRFQLAHPACRSTRADGTADEICGPATWSVLRP